MPSQNLTTQSQSASASQAQSQSTRDVETQEHHAKASASGGLNLNILGALSGALSSTSKKTTRSEDDGSETAVEDRHTAATASGAAQGQGNAYVAADAEQGSKSTKAREQRDAIAGSETKEKRVDHLGIEG